MNISQELIVNVDINLASLILMLGVLIMALRTLNFKDMRGLVYINMVILIIIYNVACMGQYYVYDTRGSMTLILLLNLIIEVSLNLVVYFFLIFVMYEIFKSRDYVKRKLFKYTIPVVLLIIANIISFFNGFLWTYDENYMYVQKVAYYPYMLIEYAYIVYAIIQYFRFKSQEKSSARFNIWLYLIPMVIGTIAEMLTGYVAFTLGSAIAFTALYLVMAREMGYRDYESGFYNPIFLSHLYSLVDNGTYDLSSIITCELADESQLEKFCEALRSVLPDGTDTIRTDANKFITVSESADRGYVFMLTEDIAMVAEEAGIEVEVDSLIKGKKEIAADFFIDNIRLRRN